MCYSNCPYEKKGGKNWGDCGNHKMQGMPDSHCFEEPEKEEEQDADAE